MQAHEGALDASVGAVTKKPQEEEMSKEKVIQVEKTFEVEFASYSAVETKWEVGTGTVHEASWSWMMEIAAAAAAAECVAAAAVFL